MGVLPSVSAYYYSPARDVFVGALIAASLALFALSGRGPSRALLDAAALFAPLIALVPTTPPARDSERSTLDAVSVFVDGPRNALRLPSYFRFDLGATKELRVGTAPSGAPLELRATVEVLNVFDQTNTIAYSWVETVNDGRRLFSAVPTRLTPRTLNVRFRVDF